MEKLCVFCKHMEFDWDAGGGGCETCGYGGEGSAAMNCTKGHWQVDLSGYHENEGLKGYRENIVQAESCRDFKPVKA